jgi:hypothetical protein
VKNLNEKTIGRPRRKQEDNIKMELEEIDCDVVDWISLVQNRDQRQALANRKMSLCAL